MNPQSNTIFFTFFIVIFLYNQLQTQHYEQVIQHNAKTWNSSYIHPKLQQKELETIIDLLLLSYQVVQASCNMILAKLIIQEELFKIHTPSLLDSWQENLQFEQNNTHELEHQLIILKSSQKILHDTYEKFKQLAPNIMQVNPQPTQTLIVDIKNALIVWGKDQEHIPNQLITVQNEFQSAVATISDITSLFDTISHSSTLKHTHLKEAASFFAKTYNDIESVIEHLTIVRKESIFKIQEFFKTFFKTYYSMVYETIIPEQKSTLKTLSTQDYKVPAPECFFTNL